MRAKNIHFVTVVSLMVAGCQQLVNDRTDRQVYRAIEQRQRDALGITSDVQIGREDGRYSRNPEMYDFVPHPIESASLPPSFHVSPPEEGPQAAEPKPPPGDEPVDAEPASDASPAVEPVEESDWEAAGERDEELIAVSIFTPEQEREKDVFALPDALAYAVRHARNLQNAKEDLYLAALDLTLERHLWTPQFVASVQSIYTDDQQTHDRAMSTTASVAVTQSLPYGGEITARVISALVRDLGEHVTSGESGTMIIEAGIPLFRGAGRVAYESRYVAERRMIYAVRTYERFRRSFLVHVAGTHFDLQQSRARIANAHKSYLSRLQDWRKAEFIKRVGQSDTVFDASRARSSLRSAETSLVSAKEQYASALDQFKIFIGMPVDTLLDVVSQEEDQAGKAVESLLPNVDERTAVQVALAHRLDLLDSLDGIDDTKRGVVIAKNAILPDLDATGSVTFDSDPSHRSSLNYNSERATWQAGISLQMDDRKTERNAYRAAMISLRRAEREHERFVDSVRADVRRALRRIDQQADLRAIQTLNVEENVLRREAAQAQFDLGMVSNQDVVDAENDLLAARNGLAGAVADYRVAILEFRLSTGTLRVADDGRWLEPGLVPDRAPDTD